MFKYVNAFTNRSGDSLPGYYARLFDSDGNQADIFADASGTPISTVSGVANAALSDDNGMFRWYIANGTYDIRFFDANDVLVSVETGVPMFEASGVYTDLSADTGASLVGSDGGDTVQEKLDAFQPTVDTVADVIAAAAFDPDEAYSGTGTATLGAPRWYLGNKTPVGDDSAICVGRAIVGASLFSHAFRDESTFSSNLDSAYTAFDARHTYITNSGAKYNHGYAFQASHEVAATNGMDLFAGFVSNMRVSAGTVDRLYHFHVQDMTVSGTGAVTQHVGLYISPLEGGTGADYAIFQESTSNPNYFAGDTQFGGVITGATNITATQEIKASAFHAGGSIATFNAGGGVFIGGNVTASGYAAIRSYNDGAGAARGLALNYTGGQVLVGAGTPVTGEQLEVVGMIGTSESYRVDGVKVVGNQGAAVADATDAATAITQLNALLARLRAHGLIAT